MLAKTLLFLTVMLGYAIGALAVDDDPLFEFDGRVMTVHELPAKLRQRLYQLEQDQYRERLLLLDSMLFELYANRLANSSGESVNDVAKRLLNVEPPSAQAVQDYFEQHKHELQQPFEAAREHIEAVLHNEALLERRQQVLEEIKADAGYKLLIGPPAPAPVDINVAGYARRGPTSAPISIIEFGDYQCPRCKQAGSIISRLMQKYPDEIEWYYLDFPVNRSGISTIVAYGGICANEQGKFWAYHDLAFNEQADLSNESAMEFARALDLDLDKFHGCLVNPQTIRTVAGSRRLGKSLGVSITPGIFVNGRPFMTDALWDNLETLIQIKRHQRRTQSAVLQGNNTSATPGQAQKEQKTR